MQSTGHKRSHTWEMSENRHPAYKRPRLHMYDLDVKDIKRKNSAEVGIRRRDNDLHRLLFMPNGIKDGTPLAYCSKGKILLDGYKQGNGIFCNCCKTEISPSQFEAHAGKAGRRQPYRHIRTSDGETLHDIALSLLRDQRASTTCGSEVCIICKGGGDLIPCDRCKRAFHAACLRSEHFLESERCCPECGDNFGTCRDAIAAGSISVARPVELQSTDLGIGGCVYCRVDNWSDGPFSDQTVLLCDQCDKEYHVGCLRENGLCDLQALPEGSWFCSVDCNRIYAGLKEAVSLGAVVVPPPLLNTIIRKHAVRGFSTEFAVFNVQWQILKGVNCSEDDPLLLRAIDIFEECFNPIMAGSVNLIPIMVRGKKIDEQDFQSMHTVVLIVNSVVVSAGLFRIFDQGLAELPLVATSREYQGKGYFQVLFSCIVRLLCSLNVAKLVLPAAEKALSIWTKKFGFKKMSPQRCPRLIRDIRLTVFQDTSMLEKELPKMTEIPGPLLDNSIKAEE